MELGPGAAFMAPVGTSPDSPGWTFLGTVVEDDLTYAFTPDDVAELFQIPAVFTWAGRTATVSFPTSSMSFAAHWLWFRRRHPRARAMHCAYSRRLRSRRRRR